MTALTLIPLRSWQDPQGDVILIYSEHECSIYFGCWQSSGEPADYVGCLTFEHAAAVRSFRREFLPYSVPQHPEPSYILRIPDSDFVREHVAYREAKYPGHPGPERFHFVVVGHDIYHEVLAAGFTETILPVAELTDPRLLALHANA